MKVFFKSSSFFRPPLFPSKFFFYEFIEKYKEFSFIFSKADAIRNRLFSLFLNNRIYNVKDLKKSFNDVIEKINKLRSNPISISILDIFLSFEEQLDSNWIITFKNFVDTYLKENQLVANIVFKLRSSDSMEYFFKRNDLIFFENYFSSQIIVPQSTENDYIEDTKTFYLNVNLIECFDIIIVKENEKMANYFFKILKFILNNYGFTTQIEEFNKVLLNEFLKEIFDEKKWWLIEIILNDEENIFYQDENSNLGINSRHLDLLLDNNQSAEKTKKRKEKKESHQYQKKKESFLNKKLLEITRIEDPKEEADDNAYVNYHENLSNTPNSPISTNQMKQKKNAKCKWLKCFQCYGKNNQVRDSDNTNTEKINNNESNKEDLLYRVDNSASVDLNSEQTTKNKNINENYKIHSEASQKTNMLFKEINKNQIIKEENFDHFIKNNILMLIRNSCNQKFLRHKTTQRILQSKWKYFPRTFYYSNLSLYILFVIFFSINIEKYKNDRSDLTPISRWISLSLTSFFLLLEVLQLILSVINDEILVFVSSFKNWLELIGFTLSIVSLSLEESEIKSDLFSISIILVYFILIFYYYYLFFINKDLHLKS